MLSLAATTESSMSKAGLDNRHRNHDGEVPSATSARRASQPIGSASEASITG